MAELIAKMLEELKGLLQFGEMNLHAKCEVNMAVLLEKLMAAQKEHGELTPCHAGVFTILNDELMLWYNGQNGSTHIIKLRLEEVWMRV